MWKVIPQPSARTPLPSLDDGLRLGDELCSILHILDEPASAIAVISRAGTSLSLTRPPLRICAFTSSLARRWASTRTAMRIRSAAWAGHGLVLGFALQCDQPQPFGPSPWCGLRLGLASVVSPRQLARSSYQITRSRSSTNRMDASFIC